MMPFIAGGLPRASLRLTLLAFAIALAGCGRSGIERASIHGKVTIDGEPVEAGSIRMVSLESEGGPSAGGEIVNGAYDIASAMGPSLGKHRVEVLVPYRTGRKVPSPFAMPPTDPNASTEAAGVVDEWAEKAPARYNKESTLEVVIQSGRNEFDVLMQSK